MNALAAALLDWFSKEARDLPWRRTKDPYAIHVSEIMLQQTQVKTVIPYWERWMKTLPTLQAVAEAKPETIHKLWEGLGYYTRVRNLQKAAQEIISRHGGKFPRIHAEILELPGIGRYTAGAIASIAFNDAQPILDGNVIRVLTRLFGIEENPRDKTTNEILWQFATELINTAATIKSTSNASPISNCSHFNQSLMELGALICTPRQPKCLLCPVRSHCIAYRTGRVEALPNLVPRAMTTARRFAAFVIEQRGKFLVRQRPPGVVNSHLWEFVNVELAAGENELTAIAREQTGLTIGSLTPLCTIKHSITRYRITLEVYHAQDVKLSRSKKETWLALKDLNSLAFTSAHKKIVHRLETGVER